MAAAIAVATGFWASPAAAAVGDGQLRPVPETAPANTVFPRGVRVPAQWRTERVAGTVELPLRGRLELKSVAPNGIAELQFRDEGEEGDWHWRSAYVRAGRTWIKIDTYNALGQVIWADGGRELRYVAWAATGPESMAAYEVRYRPGQATMTILDRGLVPPGADQP